ncbi:hypothetical protein [Marinobacterium aestuariivivens]|uniref:Histidine kinase/HSP90-like ATPase domain-containing protein n=1 Tax=Marinobacterium aestuariivivens TaxID=1698799 RepID=A0ABW1ZVH1_9GAMM
MLSVVIDNLLRNALIHGEGQIEISSNATNLWIRNAVGESGPAGTESHGYGLLIARQLCEQANLGLELEAQPGQFSARLHFNGAQAGP